MTENKVKEDNYYLIIDPTQNSEELKEKSSKEQKKEIWFEGFDLPWIIWYWPMI